MKEMNSIERTLYSQKMSMEYEMRRRGSAWDGRYGPLYVAGATIFVYLLIFFGYLFS